MQRMCFSRLAVMALFIVVFCDLRVLGQSRLSSEILSVCQRSPLQASESKLLDWSSRISRWTLYRVKESAQVAKDSIQCLQSSSCESFASWAKDLSPVLKVFRLNMALAFGHHWQNPLDVQYQVNEGLQISASWPFEEFNLVKRQGLTSQERSLIHSFFSERVLAPAFQTYRQNLLSRAKLVQHLGTRHQIGIELEAFERYKNLKDLWQMGSLDLRRHVMQEIEGFRRRRKQALLELVEANPLVIYFSESSITQIGLMRALGLYVIALSRFENQVRSLPQGLETVESLPQAAVAELRADSSLCGAGLYVLGVLNQKQQDEFIIDTAVVVTSVFFVPTWVGTLLLTTRFGEKLIGDFENYRMARSCKVMADKLLEHQSLDFPLQQPCWDNQWQRAIDNTKNDLASLAGVLLFPNLKLPRR